MYNFLTKAIHLVSFEQLRSSGLPITITMIILKTLFIYLLNYSFIIGGSGLRYHFLLLTDEKCDPVIGGRVIQLPVSAQRWLAYRADSELAGQYVSLSLTLHESMDGCRPHTVIGRQQLSLRSSRQ